MIHDWHNAIAALIASTKPDTRPLAMWLRSEKPIPPAIRNSIAELLDPGEPPRYNVRLTPKFIKSPKKHAEFFMKWAAVRTYDRLRAEGVSAKDALAEAAKIFSREKSVFLRSRQLIHKTIPKLLKRIRYR